MDVLWMEQSTSDVPTYDDWLSPREKEKLATFKFANRRADWRLGRWTAKRAVATFLEVADLQKIEIIASPNGAPAVFLSGVMAKIAISISHRKGTGACAIAERGSLGCDLELVEERSEAFIRDYFTVEEKLALSYSEDQAKMAAVIWSAKESALKALGEGLRMDTRSVEVTQVVDGGRGWGPLRVKCDTGELFEGWWRHEQGIVRTLVSQPRGVPKVAELKKAPADESRGVQRQAEG